MINDIVVIVACSLALLGFSVGLIFWWLVLK